MRAETDQPSGDTTQEEAQSPSGPNNTEREREKRRRRKKEKKRPIQARVAPGKPHQASKPGRDEGKDAFHTLLWSLSYAASPFKRPKKAGKGLKSAAQNNRVVRGKRREKKTTAEQQTPRIANPGPVSHFNPPPRCVRCIQGAVRSRESTFPLFLCVILTV